VIDQTVEVLVSKGRIKGEALALDSTFIKAYSRRNLDNRTGYGDSESIKQENTEEELLKKYIY